MFGMMPRVMLMSMPAAPMVPRGAAKPFCMSMTSSAVRSGSMSNVMGGIRVVTNRCTIRGQHFVGKQAQRARRWQIGKQQEDPGERHPGRAIVEQFLDDLGGCPDQGIGQSVTCLLASQMPRSSEPIEPVLSIRVGGADDDRGVVRES